jgi:hypothetical protein
MGADEYWTATQNCLEKFKELRERARSYRRYIPRLRHFVEQRERVKRHRRPSRDRVVEKIYQDRQAKMADFYSEFQAFTQEVLAALDEARQVVPDFEIARMKSQLNATRIADTCDAVEQAARSIEEFWEADLLVRVVDRRRQPSRGTLPNR